MTRDQFLAEMMGKCWHGKWFGYDPENKDHVTAKCRKCNNHLVLAYQYNPNYSTSPADILALQQFVMGAEWWVNLCLYVFDKFLEAETGAWPSFIKWLFSDPSRFAGLVAEFRGWKE